MILATWITRQLVFDGAANGLVVGLLAMGVVLIYRSTRVINFAVGNMGVIASYLFALFVINYGWPFWIALAVALVAGGLFAALVELAIIRRLFNASRVTLLVATVGIAQLAQLFVIQFPAVSGASRYPLFWNSKWSDVAGSGVVVRGSQLAMIIVAPLVSAVLAIVLNRTHFGRRVAGAADNPELSRLAGFNPRTVSTAVWVIAGLLSSISMILLSGRVGAVSGVVDLGPSTLNKALVAAALASLVSFPRAMAAGIAVGVGEALLRFNFFEQAGLVEFIMFLGVLVAVIFQSRGEDEVTAYRFAPNVRPIPEHLSSLWRYKHMGRIAISAAFLFGAVLVFLPGITDLPTRHQLYARMLALALCGLSVTVITGWAGQLSIAQMSFAGVGALLAAALHRGLTFDLLGTRYEFVETPYVLTLPIAALGGALLAFIVGLGSLKVRGLYLGVTTFVFAFAAERYIFNLGVFTDGNPSAILFRRTDLFGIDLSSQRSWYYVCLACLCISFIVVARLRDSGIGRSVIAQRENPDTAAGYTVNATRAKLLSFSLAGGLASLGGALVAGSAEVVDLTDAGFFTVSDSLNLIGMVVIGGLGSLVGPILGAIWVYGIPTLFDDSTTVALFSSSVGLLAVLLYFPGGLVELAHRIRNKIIDVALRRHPAPEDSDRQRPPALPSSHRTERDSSDPVLVSREISVSFGGILALQGASISVHRDEIVGLIGTNGAGKTTFMNAIGGYVPSTGSVELFGESVSKLPVAKRSARGLGRTFQAATLFPDLTVRETLMVALEARGRTPFLTTALYLPRSYSLERRRRQEADAIIDFLSLHPYADSLIAELSTGTRRIVELAGLLALDATMLCLDEPTAGVGQAEAEAFVPLLADIHREMGASMLIIEHDMALIMNVSDRLYCLEAGKVIAEGTPEAVRNDPAVVASYLGSGSRITDPGGK